MSRATTILRTAADRDEAADWCRRLPDGTRVDFFGPKRTTDQNALMWARLTDVSVQLKWHGEKYAPDEWKLLFLDALGRENKIAPALSGTGIVSLGTSSSKLSKEDMSDLIELIAAFGANHGVKFGDDEQPV